MKKVIRSPLFYMGDKYKLINQLINFFPKKINNFYEPFVGGGSVFLNIKAKKYYLNDLDKNLILLHNFLISSSNNSKKFFRDLEKVITHYRLSRSFLEDIVPRSLKNKYKKTYYAKFNKESYTQLKNDFNNSKKKDYLKLYILLIYGFNRILRFNLKNEFNLPVGNVDLNKNTEKALNDYFIAIKNKKINFSNSTYSNFLKKMNFSKNDFIYCDPPYLITSGEYNKFWNESDEIELLSILDNLNKKKIKWALSNVTEYRGKKNNILLDWSKKYKVNKIKSNYISFNDNSIKNFKEVLITNATR
ncbi:DNA adenine methylase [Candidatus Pelagibacter sp. HIMB109]|uniref:DNA adenine methylase n=1 Tax=Candidatus Pelagibacter sp. HIMB109 TaxID=3415412 RepID=UPI003F83BFF8